MIKQGLLLLAAACLALGHSKKNTFQAPSRFASQQEEQQAPPYAFGYESAGSSRQESSDASGQVTGSYRVTHEDGSGRLVKYVADRDGFRAHVDTNEPGTGPDSPAHVQLKVDRPLSAPWQAPVQQAPAQVTKFSAPAVHQQAAVQVTPFSSPAVHQAPVQAFQSGSWAKVSPHSPAPSAPSHQPYAFEYAADLEDGSVSRRESADGSGQVVGSYSLRVSDGRRRQVDYLADQGGFRATVTTNELGTGPESSAHVRLYSSAEHEAPKQETRFSSPAIQQAPIEVSRFSPAPPLQQAALQVPYAFESEASRRRESGVRQPARVISQERVSR